VPAASTVIRFGAFELDVNAGHLLRNRRAVRIKPQPFKLLHLLASRPGEIVTREEIRALLWGTDTFVDFEQGVNTAIKQIRDALNEDADHPLYVETIPKRGYRFIAPVEGAGPAPAAGPLAASTARTDLRLHKALWLNIAELRVAEVRRRALRRRLILGSIIAAALLALVIAIWLLR
jgi:DNA-binding winged helix-turn-helix (wHTH) protein